MTLHVSIDDYAEEQFGPLVKLFASYFPPGDRLLTHDYTRWLYAANPFGAARMVRVSEGSRWVAFMAMIPVMLVCASGSQKAYYVVNVLVHPDFHGKGLFGRMIDAAMVSIEAEGAALMGHPNDMALKSWQRAGMHFHDLLRPSLALPKPWLWGYRVRQAQSTSDLEPLRARLDDLVHAAAFWRVCASPEYLAWRYLQHPTNAYKVQIIERDQTPIGVQVSKRLKPAVNLLVDQFVEPGDVLAATARLPALTLCLVPDAVTGVAADGRWTLPLKKRVPFFLTRPTKRIVSPETTRLGLSPSDF